MRLKEPHPLIIEYHGTEAWEAEIKKLRHKNGDEMYCKYCYETHPHWLFSYKHFVPLCWECLLCNHYSADPYAFEDES